MKRTVDGNYQRAWKTVFKDIQHHAPETLSDVDYWQENKPANHEVEDFYEYYVWAVYNAGMAIRSLNTIWDRLTAALRDFSIDDIVADIETVRTDLQRVNRHAAKLNAVLEAAEILHNDPEVWYRIRSMTSEDAVTAIRQTFSYVGPQNTYHIVRNLGWDVPTHSGFTRELAEHLGLDCDTVVDRLCVASGYRANTTDILLGEWSRLDIHQSADEALGRFIALLGLPVGHAVAGSPLPPR